MIEGRFGFFPESRVPPLPVTQSERGRVPSNTHPGCGIDVTADLQVNVPLEHATSCRTMYEMPLVMVEIVL